MTIEHGAWFKKRKQDNRVVTVSTSLTDGLVVVTIRVEQERYALAVRRRREGNTNHEWEIVYWLYCVLRTSLRYLNLVSALELLTTPPLKIAKGCVCALVHWRLS
jgi:hypothetical protein